MRRGHFRHGLALAALLALPSPAATATQTLEASKGVSGRNILPRVAVNPDTLDVVVVWVQQIPGTLNLRVWSRLFELRADGTYRARKARRVSSASGFNTGAEVVFSSTHNRYIVFWDDFNFFAPLAPSSIHARFLRANNGKSRGAIRTVVSDGRANTFPRVTTIRGTNDSRKMILGYTAFPTAAGQDRTGAAFAELRKTLKPKGAIGYFFPTSLSETAAPAVEPQGALDEISKRPFTVGFLRDGTIAQDPAKFPGKIALGAIVNRFDNDTDTLRGSLISWKGTKISSLIAKEDFGNKDTGALNAKFIPDRKSELLEGFYTRFKKQELKVGVFLRGKIDDFGKFGREIQLKIPPQVAQFNSAREIPKLFTRPTATGDPNRPIDSKMTLLLHDGLNFVITDLLRTGKQKRTVEVGQFNKVISATGVQSVSNVESFRGNLPILGKTPILGFLFAHQRDRSSTKQEIILTIDAKLIDEEALSRN